jgi:Ca-activated chloride channel family protein
MNGGFSFESPGFLFGFLIYLPLALVGALRYRALKKHFHDRTLGRRYLASGFFFWLFLAALILALAGPRWGSRAVTEYRRGLDAAFALDLSRSMEIRDAPDFGGGPWGTGLSRLDRGRRIIRETAAALPGTRFAAAIGKGRGILAVPLTDDPEALPAFLEGLGGGSLTGRGTNLESLIDAAASAFASPFPTRRVIVLVSDGEALSGALKGALDRLRGEDITLIALGLGSDEGSPVPPAAGAAEAPSAAGAADAPPVLSSRRAEVLRYAAELTGGVYIDGNSGNAAALLTEQLRSLGPETKTPGTRQEPVSRRHLCIIAALAAFGASRLCMMKRRRGLSAVLFIFLASCSPAPGKLLVMEGNFFFSRAMYDDADAAYRKALDHADAAPYAEYGLGTIDLFRDDDEAALERYAVAEILLERSPGGGGQELRFRIPYNRGLILFGRGDYGAAAASFREALEIDGGRIEAKRNLELSLRAGSRKKRAAGQGGRGESTEEAAAILFNYLRFREQNQWKSREWTEDEDSPGPDY